MAKDPKFPDFPEEMPNIMEMVTVTFPNGMVVETVVRQRTIRVQPMLEYSITLLGKDFEGYNRTLIFRDGHWYATRDDEPGVEFVIGLDDFDDED